MTTLSGGPCRWQEVFAAERASDAPGDRGGRWNAAGLAAGDRQLARLGGLSQCPRGQVGSFARVTHGPADLVGELGGGEGLSGTGVAHARVPQPGPGDVRTLTMPDATAQC